MSRMLRTPIEDETEPRSKTLGWVLYDDSCGFCRRWVPFWAATLRKRGFEIATLQDDWVREHFQLSESELVEDLRLLLRDGRQIQGADVYRHLMRRIGLAYPLFLLSSAPGLRLIFDWCYRKFAINRFRVSRACGLPSSICSKSTGLNSRP